MVLRAEVAEGVNKLDASYRRCIKHFVEYVDKTAELAPDASGNYATQANVEAFFIGFVEKLNILPSGASRYRPAIQKLVHRENAHIDLTIAGNKKVARALAEQEEKWKNDNKNPTTSDDPHDHLRMNVPSIMDIQMMVADCAAALLTQLALAFLMGLIAFLRGKDQRATGLRSLKYIPDMWGPPRPDHQYQRYPMIGFIIPKGQSKDKNKLNRVTGMWRHARVLECTTHWVCAHLFNILEVQNIPLSFVKEARQARQARQSGTVCKPTDPECRGGEHFKQHRELLCCCFCWTYPLSKRAQSCTSVQCVKCQCKISKQHLHY